MALSCSHEWNLHKKTVPQISSPDIINWEAGPYRRGIAP